MGKLAMHMLQLLIHILLFLIISTCIELYSGSIMCMAHARIILMYILLYLMIMSWASNHSCK